jgi:ABC-2 type transport system ATP-binding protein
MTAAPQNTADLAISVRGLTKKFGNYTAVNNLSMDVKRGQIHGFLGPNGSGKTTTLRMLCGLLTPDSGEGICLGFNIRTGSYALKRHVGYMTQQFGLYNTLSVRENLEFIASVYNLPDPKHSALQVISDLGLSRRQNQLTGTLSGGWKQRLALGACMLPQPQLLLLDEPTAGVDPKARRDFWEEIHNLAAKGLTILVSTHYMDEAERCHTIAYIAYGRLLAQGSVDDVIARSSLSIMTVSPSPSFHADPVFMTHLALELEKKPSVESVTPFGMQLRVSSRNPERLSAALSSLSHDSRLIINSEKPTLEDIFIELMRTAQETQQ